MRSPRRSARYQANKKKRAEARAKREADARRRRIEDEARRGGLSTLDALDAQVDDNA